MKTVHKFVLKSYIGPMILTFFIVMFVLVLQYMWRYVDEMVGKGLGLDVIMEFMFYAAISSIPMGLPLATLLAAIMTMGNMGENYELLAMKSAGMSLPKITKPLIVLVFFVSISSFFVANNLVPYSMKHIYALIFDIRQQKQTIEFKDGIFFNGIPEISIRVNRQNHETGMLHDILIYDTRDMSGNMSTIMAKSGRIRLSQDKTNLLVTLQNGNRYEIKRNYEWYDKSRMQRHSFAESDMIIPLSGFNFERTNSEFFSSGQTKNIAQLETGIDSLTDLSKNESSASYEPLLRQYMFVNDTTLLKSDSSSVVINKSRARLILADSIEKMTVYQKKDLWSKARIYANSSRGALMFDEEGAKETLNQLYRHKIEWHRKMSLPVSIMIFFLIGASLGAIIRKGGLGMPIVVSVVFFVIYYIISITGEKLAHEGSWSAFAGMWLSTFILLPLSVFLTYKATNDSNLFNVEWYMLRYHKIKDLITNNIKRYKRGTEKITK